MSFRSWEKPSGWSIFDLFWRVEFGGIFTLFYISFTSGLTSVRAEKVLANFSVYISWSLSFFPSYLSSRAVSLTRDTRRRCIFSSAINLARSHRFPPLSCTAFFPPHPFLILLFIGVLPTLPHLAEDASPSLIFNFIISLCGSPVLLGLVCLLHLTKPRADASFSGPFSFSLLLLSLSPLVWFFFIIISWGFEEVDSKEGGQNWFCLL